MLENYLEENPNDARVIIQKVILVAQARHAAIRAIVTGFPKMLKVDITTGQSLRKSFATGTSVKQKVACTHIYWKRWSFSNELH